MYMFVVITDKFGSMSYFPVQKLDCRGFCVKLNVLKDTNFSIRIYKVVSYEAQLYC